MSKAVIQIIVLVLLSVYPGSVYAGAVTVDVTTDRQTREQADGLYDRVALQEKTDALMAGGDFAAALGEYAQLARKYPSDMYLRNQYAHLKEFMSLREKLNDLTPVEKKVEYKTKLRTYMYSRGLYHWALELDSRFCEKKTGDERDQEQLLETLLMLDKDQQAGELAAGGGSGSYRWRSLTLLLKARVGNPAEIVSECEALLSDPEAEILCHFDLARIKALAGDDRWEDILADILAEQSTDNWQALKAMLITATEFAPYRKDKAYLAIVAEIDNKILILNPCFKSECQKDCLQKQSR